jgi:hypothetical protein
VPGLRGVSLSFTGLGLRVNRPDVHGHACTYSQGVDGCRAVVATSETQNQETYSYCLGGQTCCCDGQRGGCCEAVNSCHDSFCLSTRFQSVHLIAACVQKLPAQFVSVDRPSDDTWAYLHKIMITLKICMRLGRMNYAVRRIMCEPDSVSIISLNCPTDRANDASSNGFCMAPRPNGPRSPAF